jgi:hypothetical protein
MIPRQKVPFLKFRFARTVRKPSIHQRLVLESVHGVHLCFWSPDRHVPYSVVFRTAPIFTRAQLVKKLTGKKKLIEKWFCINIPCMILPPELTPFEAASRAQKIQY